MNDFLQSIRNGSYSKDNGNTGKPRYNSQRPRRNYEPNGNYNRNNGNDRKFRPRQNNDSYVLEEAMTSIKETLTAILSNQEATKSFAERNAIAEERKAEAFEYIARHIGKLTGDLFEPQTQSAPVKSAPVQPVQSGDQAEEVEILVQEAPVAKGADLSNTDMSKDDILEIIAHMRNKGATYNEIANHLVDLNLPTFSGRGKWHAQTIHRLCQNL
jgi:hypothetical protein